MTNCTSCEIGLGVPDEYIIGSGGGRKKKYKKSQRGGAHLGLSPVSLSSSDSFDRAGNSLANTAYKVYIDKSNELAALKNQNVMMGGNGKTFFPARTDSAEDGGSPPEPSYQALGGKKRKYKTAKKYRSKSKSKQQRGGEDGETYDRILSMYKDSASGGRKRKYKTAKKYRSKSKSKQQRGGKEDDNLVYFSLS